MKKFHRVFAALAFASANTAAFALEDLSRFVPGLSARVMVAISDGDFVASTYADGQLAPADAGHRDLLTALRIENGKVHRLELPVSNSVTAAPEILKLTNDGRTAFVVERLTGRTADAKLARELAPGNRLFAVDLAGNQAKIADEVRVPDLPESLALSPDGHMVAVVSNPANASLLSIVAYENGRFGAVRSFDLANLGVRGDAAAPRGGVTATNVQWHPSGRILAVNINTQNRVAFLLLTGSGDELAVTPWGAPVEVGKDPFVGRFTPDGRHYLTADWGRNFASRSLDERLPTSPSKISVIRLADTNASPAEAIHRRIGGAETDFSSEGLAVSPDGRLVATVNMRGTAIPKSSPRHDEKASVTLLAFDPQNGALTKLADYPLAGTLPEGGTFDLTGHHFLATVFEGEGGAGIEVFRVRREGTPAFERLGRIPTPHGVHHVDVGG